MIGPDHPSYAIYVRKAQTNPKYARLIDPSVVPVAPAPAPKPPGQIEVKIARTACANGLWRWAVLVDGQVREYGKEAKSQAEARHLAHAEADALKAEFPELASYPG